MAAALVAVEQAADGNKMNINFIKNARSYKRLVNDAYLTELTAINAQFESQHAAEILIYIEKSMPLLDVISGKSTKDRAFEVFCLNRVWDTPNNSGVLLYLCVAEHHFQIIVDREISTKITETILQKLCDQAALDFKEGQEEQALRTCLNQISKLLITHFPCDANNPSIISDRPKLRR